MTSEYVAGSLCVEPVLCAAAEATAATTDCCLVAGISCWLQNITPEVLLLETILTWLR